MIKMDSEAHAFETPLVASPVHIGTPLPCRRPMVPQNLTPMTPLAIFQSLFAALLPVPIQRQPALIDRRRA
jgi:hypothetical protein